MRSIFEGPLTGVTIGYHLRRQSCVLAVRGCAKMKVKFTGLTQTLGQLSQSLIGILSQTAGSNGKLWVNPVNFRLCESARGGRASGVYSPPSNIQQPAASPRLEV